MGLPSFFLHLLDTRGFPPRWHCGQWSDALGWLHIGSDLAVFAAYTAIPLVLAWFVRRRGDLPFGPVFWLFCGFIFACGTVHLIEASIFWHPWYRLSGLAKLVTALVSWATVFALIRVLPAAIALPGLERVNAELADANAALEQSQTRLRTRLDELDAFTAIASHDLREPARHVRMLASAVQEDHHDQLDDEARELIGMLGASAGRMEALVVALSGYTRADRVELDLVDVDVASVVAQVLDDLAEQIAETEAGVEIVALPHVRADAVMLRQIVQNLLSNALRYVRRGVPPEITVATADAPPGRAAFVIRDRGRGIDPRHVEDAFAPFRRLDVHDDVDGTGIGLALCRRLAGRLDGSITLTSELGVGTSVRVELPAA